MVETLSSMHVDLSQPNASLKGEVTLAGEYARSVIAEQYRHAIAQEDGVMADTDPEYLHQMRVGSRRLGSALLAFGRMVKLPKPAREPRVRSLTKTLGQLRDLDVQIAAIQADYSPRVNETERKVLHRTLDRLQRQRERASVKVKQVLQGSRYHRCKAAYEAWFLEPQFKPLATLSIELLLPELLNPLLCSLLVHPGWLVAADGVSVKRAKTLHDLRKVCKYVRYQAEIFSPFYAKDFRCWIQELKLLQDHLGDVQDSRVLQQIVSNRAGKHANLPELQAAIRANQQEAMSDWERLRHQYLSPKYRYHLHQTILAPITTA
ncbi:MAG: CHAD domain-containing protein [Cyanobacteria bacterium J06642_2]